MIPKHIFPMTRDDFESLLHDYRSELQEINYLINSIYVDDRNRGLKMFKNFVEDLK
jgi:hypothetical protein